MNVTPTVLIVDDEIEIIRLVAEALSEEGYVVRSARNGQSAIATALTEPPHLILLDYAMPGMNGADVIVQLRLEQTLTHIPIILMSASSTAIQQSVPASDFLAKPFDLEALFDCVERNMRASLSAITTPKGEASTGHDVASASA